MTGYYGYVGDSSALEAKPVLGITFHLNYLHDLTSLYLCSLHGEHGTILYLVEKTEGRATANKQSNRLLNKI